MKICVQCGEEKDESEYGKLAKNPDGLYRYCKTCRSKETKRCYANQSEEKRRKHIKAVLDWRNRNKERVAQIEKKSSRTPRAKLKDKVRNKIQDRLYTIKKRGDKLKTGTPSHEFKLHFESLWEDGMTWENHGTAWEIHHKVPVSKFNLSDPEDFKRVNLLSNLQPEWKAEHKKKHARRVYRVNREGQYLLPFRFSIPVFSEKKESGAE
jgi:hypothetical protein